MRQGIPLRRCLRLQSHFVLKTYHFIETQIVPSIVLCLYLYHFSSFLWLVCTAKYSDVRVIAVVAGGGRPFPAFDLSERPMLAGGQIQQLERLVKYCWFLCTCCVSRITLFRTFEACFALIVCRLYQLSGLLRFCLTSALTRAQYRVLCCIRCCLLYLQ